MPELWSSHWTTPNVERRNAFLRLDAERLQRALGRKVLRPLPSLENRVFELEGDVVAKLHRPDRWSRAELDEEHAFLRELHQVGVPVAPCLESGEIEGIHYALSARIPGAHLPENPDDALLGELGRLLARLHEVGAAAPLRHRPSLQPNAFGLGNLQYLLSHGVIPEGVRERYVQRVESIVEQSEAIFRDVPMHRVHGDFYAENCLRTDDGLVVIDFDDLMTGPAVQDVWILSRTPMARPDEAESARRRVVILRAYREVRPFDERWLELIPTLRALRSVWMTAWVASRWFDPLFPETFPTFGTPAYWEQQLQKFTL